MENQKLTGKIKKFVIAEGMDLVGIAPVERFKEAPDEWTQPTFYMEDAKSVISIGAHIPNGVGDVWGEYTEKGKTIAPYLFYGYGLQNFELSRVANLLAKKIEYQGYKSLIFPPTWAISHYRHFEDVLDGRLIGDFSHRHAAVAAGLGEFGLSGLVLTPLFGARNRFNTIITNALLISDPMYDGPKICRPDKCNNFCIRDCPTHAFSKSERVRTTIGRRVFEYAQLDIVRCSYALNAIAKGSGGRTRLDVPDGKVTLFDFYEALQERARTDQEFFNCAAEVVCGDFCGRCLHRCPAYKWVNKTRRGPESVVWAF